MATVVKEKKGCVKMVDSWQGWQVPEHRHIVRVPDTFAPALQRSLFRFQCQVHHPYNYISYKAYLAA